MRVNICSKSMMTSAPQVLPNESVRTPRGTFVRLFPHSDQWRENASVESGRSQTRRVTPASDPPTHVWKGQGLPERQGMKVLGAPLGHPAFVEAFLVKKIAEQRILLDRIPLVADLQASWLLLLHCASAGSNFLLREVVWSSGTVRQQT